MNWWSLRSVGNLAVLKVSYAVLLVVPILSEHDKLVRFLGLELWLLVVLFVASLSLALANLAYDIWCPTIVKRFASPNDLYARMLEIADLSRRLSSGDNFDASLQHCKDAYGAAAQSRSIARWACTVFFLLSGAGFAAIFSYRTYVVFAAWLRSVC